MIGLGSLKFLSHFETQVLLFPTVYVALFEEILILCPKLKLLIVGASLDSVLSLPCTWVWTLVGELRSIMLCGAAKK